MQPMRCFVFSAVLFGLLCSPFTASAQTKSRVKTPTAAAPPAVRTVVSPPVGPAAWSDQPVELTMTPQWSAERGFEALQFIFTFDTPWVTELVLQLPNAWGGEQALHTHWRDLRAEGAALAPLDEPFRYKLTFERGTRISLHWRVVNGAGGDKAKSGNDYRPLLTRTHFQVLGNAAVPTVEGMWSASPARFALRGMPAGAAFASDLEHGTMGRAMTVADLAQSVLVGGDFRVLDAGNSARIAIRGQWPRPDAEWQTQFARIAQAHRAYWGSKPEPFLVTVLDLPSLGPSATSVGGTGLADSFAFFATTNARAQVLDQVMAHEMMHTWVPRRIGSMPRDNEALGYWLSEGFTDFVSWRSLVRAGLWTPEQFATAFNEQVKAHDQLPERNATNSAIGAGFWTNGNMQRLPYMRGMLFGQWLDLQVRQATQGKASMDDVLLRMQAMAEENQRRLDRDQHPATVAQNLRAALRDVADFDAAHALDEHIERGQPLALPANTFAPCGEIASITRPAFDRGFDVQTTTQNRNTVAGTRPGSPAHIAGLRDGMRIIRRTAGEIGNAAVPLAYELQDGMTVRNLSWLPAGAGTEQFRELRIDSQMTGAQRGQCVKRLGG